MWRPSTRATITSHLDNHVLPAFDDRRLGSVRPTEVQAFTAGLTRSWRPPRCAGSPHAVCRFPRGGEGPAHHRLAVRGHEAPEVDRRSSLTVAQVRSWAEAMPDNLSALVVLMAGCGLRIRRAERTLRRDACSECHGTCRRAAYAVAAQRERPTRTLPRSVSRPPPDPPSTRRDIRRARRCHRPCHAERGRALTPAQRP